MKTINKMLALVVAFTLLAVPFVVASDSDDSAADPAGAMNVYVNTGSGWSFYDISTTNAYNGVIALESTAAYNSVTDVISDDYTYSYTYGGSTYYDITSNYGDISTLSNIPEASGNTWNTLVYISNGSTFSWNVGSDNIGWYKPFADYMQSYATANVALWFGDATSTTAVNNAISTLTTFIASSSSYSVDSLTSISTANDSVFEYMFYLQVSEDYSASLGNLSSITVKTYANGTYGTLVLTSANVASELEDGIVVVGYGSDAELALINAVGSSLASFYSTSSPVPGYNSYGWMDSLFGLSTDYSGGNYHWWASYTSNTGLGDSTDVMSDFVVGAYSALTNSPLADGTIALVYA